ncbi:MAG TPA: SusD/RagB family nutrient-binding outer membrane lipoprotein [Cyclobacteriaceae bacterium]|nr:SusD/RagB family nutrient-binding outer membrane lipoprotein [Cyclobacteriaceae bacterium]
MKKIYKVLVVAVLMLAASCSDNLTDLNVDPKAYSSGTVPGATLMSNATRNLVNAMTSASVNQGIFRYQVQYWAQATYQDEVRYDLTTRNIPQTFWTLLYRDVLKDLQEATRLISKDPVSDTRDNQLAIVDILAIYTYSTLVNTFGDVPYTKALDGDNLSPVYDDAATIYTDLLTRLDADITKLFTATGTASFTGGADLIYGGSISKWLKFANSLKLRMGMTLIDSNPTLATSTIVTASNGSKGALMTSNADNAFMTYLTTPNANPVWVDVVQSGRQDIIACKTIVNMMNTLNDPRRSLYFTFDVTGSAYSGGTPGTITGFSQVSKPSAKLSANNFRGVLLDYSEVQFYLAEAVARGLIAGTAATYYNNGITASFTDWDPTNGAANAATYLANPLVDYATAIVQPGATYKTVIGTQKYLALYNRGFEAWTEVRRLDAPTMGPVTSARTVFPIRYTYPVSEQNLNTANFNSASAKVAGGSDQVGAKLFWDKF